MLEIAKYWIAASYLVGIGLALEQLRRPLSTWQAAGRERRFWVSMTLVTGFHGLAQFTAVAYLATVVPRFRAAGSASAAAQPVPAAQPALLRAGSRVALRRGERTAVESLALVAAMLVFASSFIHAAVIADHADYWLPFGVCFAIATVAQAAWAALVYREPCNPRLLVAGAVGNGALVVVWSISRLVGLPVGPDAGKPEAVGAADVLSTLDELMAVVLIGVVLAASKRLRVSQLHVRLASTLAGPIFIWSILLAFGAEHHH
jgi:hypothetical protein